MQQEEKWLDAQGSLQNQTSRKICLYCNPWSGCKWQTFTTSAEGSVVPGVVVGGLRSSERLPGVVGAGSIWCVSTLGSISSRHVVSMLGISGGSLWHSDLCMWYQLSPCSVQVVVSIEVISWCILTWWFFKSGVKGHGSQQNKVM